MVISHWPKTGGVATVAYVIWVGSGHPQPLHHPRRVQSFIKCLGKRQLWVQNACSVTPEVDRKYDETRVSKVFNALMNWST